MTHITLIPNDNNQFLEWQTKLSEAGADYHLIKSEGKDAIFLTPDDAINVLGFTRETLPQPKKKRSPLATIGIVLALLLIPALCGKLIEDASAPYTPEERREKLVEGIGTAALNAITLELRNQMNDPGSFRLENYNIIDVAPDSIVVAITYSGKNTFGGRVKDNLTTVVDTLGNIVRVVNK